MLVWIPVRFDCPHETWPPWVQIPRGLSELAPVLRTLDLSGNKLGSLPPFIGDLASLKLLQLDNNRLTEVRTELRFYWELY